MDYLFFNQVPKITVIMKGSYGPSSYAMVCLLMASEVKLLPRN